MECEVESQAGGDGMCHYGGGDAGADGVSICSKASGVRLQHVILAPVPFGREPGRADAASQRYGSITHMTAPARRTSGPPKR